MEPIRPEYIKTTSVRDVLRKYIDKYGDDLIDVEDIQTYEGTISFRIPTAAKNMLQHQAKLLNKTTAQHIADLAILFEEQIMEDDR